MIGCRFYFIYLGSHSNVWRGPALFKPGAYSNIWRRSVLFNRSRRERKQIWSYSNVWRHPAMKMLRNYNRQSNKSYFDYYHTESRADSVSSVNMVSPMLACPHATTAEGVLRRSAVLTWPSHADTPAVSVWLKHADTRRRVSAWLRAC